MVWCGNLFGLCIGIKLIFSFSVRGVLNKKLCVFVFIILVKFMFLYFLIRSWMVVW